MNRIDEPRRRDEPSEIIGCKRVREMGTKEAESAWLAVLRKRKLRRWSGLAVSGLKGSSVRGVVTVINSRCQCWVCCGPWAWVQPAASLKPGELSTRKD